MRQVRDVLRLKHACGMSERLKALGLGWTTVGEYLRRASVAGLEWPLPAGLSDAELERVLFPGEACRAPHRPQPDWPLVHAELKRPGLTLRLLWEEYRGTHPDGYSLSRFCELYQAWRSHLAPVMRQTHRAGEKMFVDFAGQMAEVIEPTNGEVRTAQIFVAVLGASFTYAEATWTQTLPDWIGAQCARSATSAACPRSSCPTTSRPASKACIFEPGLNRTYAEMAARYGTAIVPARPRKPRDKAKVEVAVQVVERWILAKLRHRRFFTLAELNHAIAGLVDELNRKPSRHLGASRRQLFEQIDQPALKPLPAEPYEYAEWKECRVGIDYHVEIDKHCYSVPHSLVRQPITARITAATIELFYRGRRVAAHLRSYAPRRHTTVAEHMPSAHRRYAGWTHERLHRAAADIGPETARLVDTILERKPHPEQGFRACLGIVRLLQPYPRLFRNLCRTRLLILDDWGPEPMTAEQRRDLLEIVEDRYGRASTLLTSQLPVSRWHDVVAEPTLADAILDRIVHHAQRIELKGDSLRKRQRAPA